MKYLLVGFLYGIPSERQIERRVQTDIALRWYLGLDLFDRVPDHSTVSQLRRRKPSFRKVFRRLFEEVVGQCIEKGLVSGRVVGADSTHVRANASRASEELVEVAEEAGVYWERLDDYEEEGLEELERRTGKRRKKRTKQIKRDNRRTHKRVSRTDPESGHLKRPGKPEGPHYLAHQAVDSDYGIIVGQTVTAGDVNDSVPFLGMIEHIHENVVPIQAATRTPPTIFRWPIGRWVNWGSAFSCGRKRPPRGCLSSLRGTIFAATRTVMCTSVPLEKSCV